MLATFDRDFMILIKDEGTVEGYIAISNRKFSAYFRGLRGEFAMDEILREQKNLKLEIKSGISSILNCRISLMEYLLDRVTRQ